MSRIRAGFSLVELLIVVAIIGILTTIGAIGFSRYQADARDNERAAKASILVEALEKYYDQHGEYPSCSSITQPVSTVVSDILPGIEAQTLKAPLSSDENSIACIDLTLETAGDYFSYTGDSSDTCISTEGSACLVYQIKYKEESTGTIVTIESRRQSKITGAPSISCSTSTFSQVNCSWTDIPGSLSYEIQYATNSSFTAGQKTVSTADLQSSLTGLNYCSQYYFRVRAISSTGSGAWSLTAARSTSCLARPSCSVAANSFTQITASWGAVSGATSYTLEYDNNSDFSSLTGTYSGTALSSARTGLSYGTTYYFRVKANVSNGSSSWSPTCQVATLSLATPPAPTNCGVTFSSFCADIPDIANASGYTFQCSSDNATWSTTNCYTSTITSSTHTFSGAAYNSTYYVRARAVNGSYTSSWSSSTAMKTLSLATPSSCSATANSFSQITASWGAVSNATTYTVQGSTSSSFSSVTEYTTANKSQAFSSLAYGTTYYFRVRANVSNGSSSWSPRCQVATLSLATPSSCSATANSFSQITASWGAVSGATSYTLEYDNNSDFSSLTGTYSGTALSSARTGLSYGTTYYFRVKANVSNGSSSWSPRCQVATLSLSTPSTPTNCGVTTISFCADIPNIANASGYQFQCSTNNSTWGSGCDSGTVTSSTYTFTGASQGVTYYIRARAVNGSYSGNWSGSLAISTPSPVKSSAVVCSSTYNIRSAYDIVLWLEETSLNVNANTSTIKWTVYRRSLNTSYHTWNLQYDNDDRHSVYVNGTQVLYGISTSYRFVNSYNIYATEALNGTSSSNQDTSLSGTISIEHNADGTKTISGSASDSFGNQVFGSASCSINNYVLSDLR